MCVLSGWTLIQRSAHESKHSCHVQLVSAGVWTSKLMLRCLSFDKLVFLSRVFFRSLANPTPGKNKFWTFGAFPDILRYIKSYGPLLENFPEKVYNKFGIWQRGNEERSVVLLRKDTLERFPRFPSSFSALECPQDAAKKTHGSEMAEGERSDACLPEKCFLLLQMLPPSSLPPVSLPLCNLTLNSGILIPISRPCETLKARGDDMWIFLCLFWWILWNQESVVPFCRAWTPWKHRFIFLVNKNWQ